ncbi:MAG: cysteine hydrolase [Thaumarchaeota archaeon]|nr:cysteine hydrolase [Nitrososphaerota archaeon]
MKQIDGKQIRESIGEIIVPKTTALLVWDVQYDIASRAFNIQDMIANLKEILPAARSAGVTVAYSQQTAFPLEQEKPVWIRQRMRNAGVDDPSKTPSRNVEGTRGWEIFDEVKPQLGDLVFRKRRPTAFIGTEFDLVLRNRGIEAVVLTGVSTEGGIEGTARDGLALGYYMVVARDCVGSSRKEAHDMALKYIESVFDVTDSKTLLQIWSK